MQGWLRDELEKAKSSYVQQLNGILGKDNQLLGILHRYQQADRGPDFLNRRVEKISTLSKAQVDKAIKKLVDLENLVIITAGDFGKESK